MQVTTNDSQEIWWENGVETNVWKYKVGKEWWSIERAGMNINLKQIENSEVRGRSSWILLKGTEK